MASVELLQYELAPLSLKSFVFQRVGVSTLHGHSRVIFPSLSNGNPWLGCDYFFTVASMCVTVKEVVGVLHRCSSSELRLLRLNPPKPEKRHGFWTEHCKTVASNSRGTFLDISVSCSHSGGGGFFLACEDFWRTFDHSFPTCTLHIFLNRWRLARSQ